MYELWYQLLFDNVMARYPGLSHYNLYLWIFPLWKIRIISSMCRKPLMTWLLELEVRRTPERLLEVKLLELS